MKRNIYIYLIGLVLLTGCSKFLEDYSQDLVVVKKISDLDEILLGSVYLPSTEVKELNYGDIGWWLHILDDDVNTVIEPNAIKGRTEMDGSFYGYTTWQFEVGRSYDGGNLAGDKRLWEELYQRINATNIILNEIDGIDQAKETDKLDALRIKGESHFLRAQFYFLLVNIYGSMYTAETAETTAGVPLKLTHFVEHDKLKTSQFTRSSVGQVYHQIVKDLEESITYFSESPQRNIFYRANKRAAMLLLSRVYLYMQEWEKAKLLAEDLLKLNKDLMDYPAIPAQGIAIAEGNPEIIFSHGSANLQNAFTGRGGDFCITRDLYNTYEATDARKSLYFTHAFSSDSIALNTKYKTGLHRSTTSDLFLLRNAEAYLNMAEACAMLGDVNGANLWLNNLKRKRFVNYVDLNHDVSTIIEEVRRERRRELCLEGHRWFDLRRYAVNKIAPFSRTIEHVYVSYNWDDKNILKQAEVYQLLPNDPAYTFAIPKAVLDFDLDMGDNPRNVRKLNRLIEFE
ncbi:SusD family protein [Sphingobacterium nematocida]|uniref:SusD family protein n=1 Tax=Sphingobacterium nematocida TaxID=1513896 RepID=A0A1T5FH24_9SPHI|nr:RagB/SusD family nutrient uptake outer membrane protein [Sphingobacterium nematocida]SKB95412.1 SusD family protein [Sphingobacterium nematocida]